MSYNCLWCDQNISTNISWENLFTPSAQRQLCALCEEKLEVISGERCEVCSRPSSKAICKDCDIWGNDVLTQKSLIFNYSIYSYNDTMQEMIARWKYRGDYVLIEIFKQKMLSAFKTVFSFLKNKGIVIPIPLSKERLIERGFNQAKALGDCLPADSKEVLTRAHSEKQSKKSRYERMFMDNPFEMNKKINKPALLVDDIYTTGTTLRHAATLLKANGCPAVYALTLIRS